MAKTSFEVLSRHAEPEPLTIILGEILFISPFLVMFEVKKE